MDNVQLKENELTDYQKDYIRKRKKTDLLGTCIRCGYNKTIEGATICEVCSNDQKKRLRTLTTSRKIRKLCIRCGREDERTLQGKTRCTKCWLKETIKRKEREKLRAGA